MKISFRDIDFDLVTRFWNEFHPERYRIDSELLRKNTVESPTFDWGASYVEQADGETLGLAIVKKSPHGLYSGPDQDVAHLSAIAYREPNYGIDLLAEVKRILRDRGYRTLVFGQDSRHFFPGCPTDATSLCDFLMVEGFQPGEGTTFDLERDLSDYVNPYSAPEGDELRIVTEQDLPELEVFFRREFPGRWRYDVMSKVAADGPGCVFGLFHGEQVDGFALIQDSSQSLPISGAVWRADLGPDWGALGPIGVSRSLRGKGSGHALLGAALTELKNRGARRTIIDWTTLGDFYGRHGFEPTRHYRSWSLKLEAV